MLHNFILRKYYFYGLIYPPTQIVALSVKSDSLLLLSQIAVKSSPLLTASQQVSPVINYIFTGSTFVINLFAREDYLNYSCIVAVKDRLDWVGVRFQNELSIVSYPGEQYNSRDRSQYTVIVVTPCRVIVIVVFIFLISYRAPCGEGLGRLDRCSIANLHCLFPAFDTNIGIVGL